MKFLRKMLILALIIITFTSGSLNLIFNMAQKSKKIALKVYSDVENYMLEMSMVSEIKYEEYYIKEPQFNSAYKSLDDIQKELYKILYAISYKMPDGFVKLYKKYDSINRDIAVAYNALLYDNVEIFWMPYKYIISEYENRGAKYTVIAFNIDSNTAKAEYNVTKSQRDVMRAKLDKKVSEILKLSENLKDEYEIERFFNDYICDNVEYKETGELVSTAYGALINKKAHCEGYSRAFKMLCNKVGIECDLVCGVSFGEGHMWNVVNINGTHSNVDVTWNDRKELKSYIYFNITDEQIKFDHELSPLHSNLSDKEIKKGSFNFVERVSSYTGNTYYERTGCILSLDFREKAPQKIKEFYENGDESIEFLFTSENALSQFKENNMLFITKIQSGLNGIKIKSYVFERDVLVLYFKR